MNPYQRASQAIREGEEGGLNLVSNAALTFAGGGLAATGSKLLNKTLPAVGSFLSQYVPESLAIKGLNKIDSRLGEFIQGAMDQGYTFDDIKGFIGEKIEKTQQDQKENIIKQHSPELHAFLDEKIKSGMDPLQAAGIARIDQKGNEAMRRAITKLEKEHKMNWSDIVEMVFGKKKEENNQSLPVYYTTQADADAHQAAHQPTTQISPAPTQQPTKQTATDRLAQSLEALHQLRQSRGP